MREVEFRAWDIDKKKFIDYFDISCGGVVWTQEPGCSPEHPNAILELPTGLKDKNGREVYAGDIVKFDDVDPEADVSSPAVVTWAYGAFMVMCDDENFYHTDDGNPVILGLIKPELFEVIGNIHENPELLEEEE